MNYDAIRSDIALARDVHAGWERDQAKSKCVDHAARMANLLCRETPNGRTLPKEAAMELTKEEVEHILKSHNGEEISAEFVRRLCRDWIAMHDDATELPDPEKE